MDVVVPINYVAVFAAAVAGMVIGSLWYGPLFGKPWKELMGFTPEKMAAAKKQGMEKTYALAFLGLLLMSYALAHSIVFAEAYLKTSGAASGVQAGVWTW